MTNREKLIELLTERDGKVDSRSLRTFLAKDPLVHCFSTPWCEQYDDCDECVAKWLNEEAENG